MHYCVRYFFLVPIILGLATLGVFICALCSVPKKAVEGSSNPTSQTHRGGGDDRPMKKCRTYERFRKVFMARLEKTDDDMQNEVFEELTDEYSKTGNNVCTHEDPKSETFLKNLENFLHQKDNAEEFLRRNGIRIIMEPCLWSNLTSMQTLSARVLGVAVQSSLRVQVAALEDGLMTPLMKNILFEKNYESRASSLFALSCLLRSFPLAQTHFIVNGGLDMLLQLFDGTSADLWKLQMKIVILFHDLISEKKDVAVVFEDDAKQSFKELDLKLSSFLWKESNDLKKVNLKATLVDRGWCNKFRAMLNATIPDTEFGLAADAPKGAVDFDLMDKFSKATMSFESECPKEFLNEDKSLEIEENLMSEDDVYEDVHETVQQLFKNTHAS